MTSKHTAASEFVAPQALTAWYREYQRDLPWRRTRDPYAVWLSETMLQQTRVDTVIPYYHRFLEAYPTVRDLATADEAEVLKRWQGLGYYSRARNLQRAAEAVVREHGGVIPPSADLFGALPGVGPYTTGAVMSIAFDQPVPAVDGNVLRVMSRYLAIMQPVSDVAVKRRITDETAAWLMDASPNELTQGLMELGAMVCVPRDPKCDQCPLRPGCAAFARGLTRELPMKKPKAERRKVTVAALWFEHDGRLLLEQRPKRGLLADMWQLPAVEVGDCGAAAGAAGGASDAGLDLEAAEQSCAEPDLETAGTSVMERLFGSAWAGTEAAAGVEPGSVSDRSADRNSDRPGFVDGLNLGGGVSALAFAEIARLKHIFTHLEWDVRVLRPVSWQLPDGWELPPGYVWADAAALEGLALPRVYDKLLSRHFGG